LVKHGVGTRIVTHRGPVSAHRHDALPGVPPTTDALSFTKSPLSQVVPSLRYANFQKTTVKAKRFLQPACLWVHTALVVVDNRGSRNCCCALSAEEIDATRCVKRVFCIE